MTVTVSKNLQMNNYFDKHFASYMNNFHNFFNTYIFVVQDSEDIIIGSTHNFIISFIITKNIIS